ncbi:MAG: hypothetical protein AAGJ32_12610 [Pseudomonadota bacterium]
MLLRRISTHVKEQNWFAVFLDFFIVVIGVFIGLQVANWNEVRAGEERLRSQLVSFQTELIMARSDLDKLEAYYTAQSVAAAELRLRLAADDPTLTEDEFNRLAFSASLERPFIVRYRNFEELSTSGALARISDDELRNLLFRWDNQLTDIRSNDVSTDRFRSAAMIPVYASTVVFGNAFQQDERYSDFSRTDRFEFDVDAIASNLEFDNAISMLDLTARQRIELLVEFRVTSEELIAALEKSAP